MIAFCLNRLRVRLSIRVRSAFVAGVICLSQSKGDPKSLEDVRRCSSQHREGARPELYSKRRKAITDYQLFRYERRLILKREKRQKMFPFSSKCRE